MGKTDLLPDLIFFLVEISNRIKHDIINYYEFGFQEYILLLL